MRKSFFIIAVSFLSLCLLVMPAAAQYIWDPGNVVTGIETTIQVQNTFLSSDFTEGRLYYGDGASDYGGALGAGRSDYFSHTYQTAGTYTLTYTYTQDGVQKSSTKTITVSDPYATVSSISASNPNINRGQTSSISTNIVTNLPSSCRTNLFTILKDGNIVETKTVTTNYASFTFDSPGVYSAVVTVLYNGIVIGSGSAQDIVNVAGSVSLSVDKTVIQPQNSVTFTASTNAGTVSSWDWSFGDGSTTSTSSGTTTHTYTTTGAKTVNVTANLVGGGTDYVTKPGFVVVLSPPVVTNVTISQASQTVNNAVTAVIPYTYTPGSTLPSGYAAYIRINNGSGAVDYPVTSYTSPISLSITYDSTGTKTVTAVGIIKSSGNTLTSATTRSGTVSILPPAPGGLSFTTVPANGEIQVGDTVTFIASVTSGGSVTGYKWNFGDGTVEETTSSSQITHTYNTAVGYYTVTVTALGTGGNTTYTKQNAVHVGETYVTLNKNPAIYYIGEDTQITATYSISPYSSSSTYTMELWQLNDLYEPVSKISTITLNSASGSRSFNIAGISTNTNYNVYLVTGGGYIASAAATVRYNGDTLTVYVYNGNQPLTAITHVILQSGTTTVMETNTSTGTAVFAPLTSGNTYTVVASANGYEQQSTTVTLSGDMSVTLVLGGSKDTGGWGQWEPFACSWQIFDKNGKPIPGATVTLQQVAESFGDISIFNQWNGFSIGETLVGAPQTLVSDVYGKVTFNCFPNVYYRITVTYGSDTDTQYYNTGAVSATYPFVFGDTGGKTKELYQVVYGYVETSQGDGTITVTYTDTANPVITTNIAIQVLNSNNTVIDQWSAPASSANQTFTIQDRYNHDYKVQITANTSMGQYTKTFSVHFVGPRLNFGIPEALLIWISAFLLFAIGGAFTRVTVPIGCVAVSFMAWLLFGIGWLWQLEAAVSSIGLGFILFFATFVSILFVIADSR